MIRRAGPEDAAALLALRKPFWEDQIAKGLLDIPATDEDALLASSQAILKKPRTSVYLALEGDQPFAYVYGQTRIVPGVASPMVAIIEELYVDPKLGSPSAAMALLRNVIDDMKGFGATRIQCRVLSKNMRSRKLVEAYGFSVNLLLYELDQPI